MSRISTRKGPGQDETRLRWKLYTRTMESQASPGKSTKSGHGKKLYIHLHHGALNYAGRH